MRYSIKNWHTEKRTYTFGVPTWYSNFHLGLDIILPWRTNIYAPEGGYAKYYRGEQGGRTMMLTTDRYVYRFLHLSRAIKIRNVKEGDLIAQTDSTGWSSRGHLHIDISNKPFQLSNKNNFVDPEIVFPKMEYVIDKSGNQWLLLPLINSAFAIADITELEVLTGNGLSGSPRLIDKINNNFTVYPLIRRERLKDLLNL